MTLAPATFDYVRDLVFRESAIVLEPGKEYLVETRLRPLVQEAGHGDVDSYVSTLQSRTNPVAVKKVVEAMTTNETSWFRDGDPFSVLRTTVFPDLAGRRPARQLRVWSAACSSGQEPYSIAISARETPAVAGFRVEVLGTDLNEAMVERARAGQYSQLEVNRGLPATTLVKYFARDGVSWRIAPEVAATVSFRPLNLVRPLPAIGRFDVVFLRNVLIYFDLASKQDILRRVRQVLAPDGYLFLGAAEMTMGVDDSWERVPAGRSSVYRIKGGAA